MKKAGILFFCGGVVCFGAINAASTTQEVYTSVANDLIEIRKKYPDTQEKIYSILDRIGKMNSIVQKAEEQQYSLTSSIAKKDKESSLTKNENDRLKQELATVKSDLDVAKKKLEEEQMVAKGLEAKQKTLLTHVDQLRVAHEQQKERKEKKAFEAKDVPGQDSLLIEDVNNYLNQSQDQHQSQPQSLRRNSTSEPTSPR
jgi:chromosome segregation ATPase